MDQLRTKDSQYAFPPVEESDEQGFLAYGGDLSPARLISAYESGIFPWYEEGQPILWWCPPQRMILFPSEFKVSKSLNASIRNRGYSVKIDRQFDEVIDRCSKIPRQGQSGTWITEDMKKAYSRLHTMGFAHSFETYKDGKLVGGLYGISLGRAFFGESMFSDERDASKVAFAKLVSFSLEQSFAFVDCQLYTDHLASLGAAEIPRNAFMDLLKQALAYPDLQQPWHEFE